MCGLGLCGTCDIFGVDYWDTEEYEPAAPNWQLVRSLRLSQVQFDELLHSSEDQFALKKRCQTAEEWMPELCWQHTSVSHIASENMKENWFSINIDNVPLQFTIISHEASSLIIVMYI